MSAKLRALSVIGILALGSASARCAPAVGGATGETLSRQCSVAVQIQDRTLNHAAGNDEEMAAAFCFGVVRGVQDTILAWHRAEPHTRSPIACVPAGVSTSESVKIVRKYLAENPALLHLPDTTLVAQALRNAFPCGRN
jgi:hypothetical protein